jgi:hypothetical protein
MHNKLLYITTKAVRNTSTYLLCCYTSPCSVRLSVFHLGYIHTIVSLLTIDIYNLNIHNMIPTTANIFMHKILCLARYLTEVLTEI